MRENFIVNNGKMLKRFLDSKFTILNILKRLCNNFHKYEK